MTRVKLFWTFCMVVVVSTNLFAQLPSRRPWIDTLTAWSDYSTTFFSRLRLPERDYRKFIRRDLQRRGYANVLSSLLDGDGLSALLSFVRTKLQLEYSLDHYPIFYRTPKGELLVIPEDWSFPADPWKKDTLVFTK